MPRAPRAGTRYNAETLEVRPGWQDVAEILAMSVSTAREFFDEDSDIVQHLDALLDVGLSYISPRPVSHRVVGRRGATRQAGGRYARPAG
jgi:excinuclease UvrABC ATPase subunit